MGFLLIYHLQQPVIVSQKQRHADFTPNYQSHTYIKINQEIFSFSTFIFQELSNDNLLKDTITVPKNWI